MTVRGDTGADSASWTPTPNVIGAGSLSFISLSQVLPAAASFAAESCWLIALIKPQFEVGRGGLGKRGLVRDEDAAALAVERLRLGLMEQGWQVLGTLPSPLPGKTGNSEILIGARLDA